MNDASNPSNVPTPALLSAWLEQSHDLLVMTDAMGQTVWSNRRFRNATGTPEQAANLLSLLHRDPGAGTAHATMRAAVQQALRSGSLAADTELCLCGADDTPLWVRAIATRVEEVILWTLQDITAARQLAAQAQCHLQREVKNSPEGQPARTPGIMMDDTEVYELARSLDSTTAQLELAVDLANIVIWRHDLKGNRLHFNERGYTLLGTPFRPEGFGLDEMRALIHPDDLARVQDSAREALGRNTPTDIEARFRRTDGSWRCLLTRRVVERDLTGQAVAFVGVALDVTERAEHVRRAEALARRLEAAAQAARMGIWTSTAGTEKTEWNAQMYELFDRVGETRPPSLREWLERCVHPDDSARVRRAAGAYLSAKPDTPFEVEFRTLRRDGSVRWIVVRADADRSDTDNQRYFGVAMEVTAHREALAALHEASERSALITRSAGIGTWETDGPDAPALWDEQMFRLRGMTPRNRALTRDERLALVHPDDVGRVLDSHANPGTVAMPFSYEFRVRLPDGSYRWLASRSAAVLDASGRAVRRVGVNWDVTEAKNVALAQQKALLAQRESQAKSQFLSRMSHELRTPLNAVLGFTQLLQSEGHATRSPSQSVKLGHIRAAGEHLLALINDVLDLSSLEAGTLKLEMQSVELAAAVAQALPLVAGLAEQHRVTLHAASVVGAVRADPTRLRQVLVNLLSNAIKYNRPRGQVVVESEARPDGVCLRVRDTGRGLTAEQLGHLFEPFNRLGMERDGIEGSGIGLTVVKALVEGMDGHISANSQAGQGTVFEVVLPASEGLAAPLPTPPDASRAGPRRERSGQLLYIEDNSVNVLLVEELVRSLSGLNITSEGTGAAGVARALSLRPDVILVDMHLPDFDGFEVLRRLRAQPETATIPCIALSANAMPEDVERGLAGGFDDYWTKPIKFKPFLESLERLFPTDAQTLISPAAPPGRAA